MVVTCKLMGGLGNQLFQIFATISHALSVHDKFEFTNETMLTTGIHRPTYWSTMLARLRPFTVSPDCHAHLPILREAGFAFQPLPLVKNANLFGYFQSPKYFETHYDTICRLLGIASLQEEIKNHSRDWDHAVSLHFRLGDYKHIQHCHPILNVDYYARALNHVIEQDAECTKVLYFCENEDAGIVAKSIESLQCAFPSLTFERASPSLQDWEQLLAMSSCKHHIIANSSFSWWGAYFNPRENKVVCYPSTWFGEAMKHHDTRDLCPTEWRKITNLL